MNFKRTIRITVFKISNYFKIKFVFSALLFLLFLAAADEHMIRAAETQTISEQCQMVYFSDGSSLLVESMPGEVVITGSHVKSKARISYETTGFMITLEPTGGMVENYPYSSALLLSKEEIIENEVTTSYRIDRNSIFEGVFELYCRRETGKSEEELRQNFLQEINQNHGIDFYLHNEFCVIRREGGSGSKVLERSRSYRNLGTPVGENPKMEGIWNAVMDLYGVEWAEPTKKKLAEYYDIHLRLYMSPCSVDIILADESGNMLACIAKDAPSAQYAAFCRKIPEEYRGDIVLEDGLYRLTERSIRKSYVCYGEEQRKEQMYSMDAAKGLRIRLGNGELEFHHLHAEKAAVYLICEKLEKPEPEKPSGQETETGLRITLFDAEPEMRIAAWDKDNPLFYAERSSHGIPVNEYLYAEANVPDFLLEAEFVQKEGELLVSVPVSRTYILEWREKTGKEDGEAVYEEFSDVITRRSYVTVKRRYRYTELVSLEYYLLSEVHFGSRVFEDGEVVWRDENDGSAGVSGPGLISWQHFEGEQEHLKQPPEMENGIVLDTLLLYGSEGMPALPEEDFAFEAERRIGELLVRDDRFVFGGTDYLADEFREYSSEAVPISELLKGIVQKRLEVTTERERIPEYLLNGCYESRGEAVYTRAASMTMQLPEKLTFEPDEINSVYIHTPVYCSAILEEDNKKFCQLVNPSEGVALLIPDEEGISGDFIAAVSNTGYHSGRKGYGTRDFAKAMTEGYFYLAQDGKGVFRNEIKFPFDVYRDVGSNFCREDDILCPANQWIAIGRERVRFYLPVWAPEGIFEVQFRTIAVNGTGREDMVQPQANTQSSAYAASDTRRVQISGKLYGLRITDITDYPLWENVFGPGNRPGDYSVGTCDEYGRETERHAGQTLPVGPGSHPRIQKACYKPGYVVRFGITVSGTEMQKKGAGVEIIPKFYYTNPDGSGREEVSLYMLRRLDGREYLVKAGDETDRELRVNPADSGYPGYSYGKICIMNERHYTGEWVRELQFEYSLPRRLFAVSTLQESEITAAGQGIDFSEAFWKRDGFLIVNFEITGLTGDKKYLSYDNSWNAVHGYCNMWLMEAQICEKKDKETDFRLCPGDVLIIPLESSIRNDYIAGGIY